MAIHSDPAVTETVVPGSAERSTLNVKVVFMGEIQGWAGRRELDIELPLESTIHALAQKLFASCGAGFAQRALTKEGAFQPHVAIFVNGVQIGRLDGTKTVLTGGQVQLMLLPMYEGG
jgi:hypothetical protein